MTGDNREMILLVTFSLLVFSVSEGASTQGNECLSNLKNLAVYEGDQDILLNLAADIQIVLWTLIPTSDEIYSSYPLQDGSGNIDSSLATLFYINQTGLVILEAKATPYESQSSTSGIYVAQCPKDGNSTVGVKLLVVRDVPECSCNATSPTEVQLSCSIVYTDGAVNPINANMTWENGDNVYATDTPTRMRLDYYAYVSTSRITVDSTVPATFTCTVTYNAPTDIQYQNLVMNAPEFSASCSVTLPECRITTNTRPTVPPPPSPTLPPTTIIEPPPATAIPPPTTIIQLPPTTAIPPATTIIEPPPATAIPPPTTIIQLPPNTAIPSPITVDLQPTTTTPLPTSNPLLTTPDITCIQPSECQPDGTSLPVLNGAGVVKAELYARYDKCCPNNLACGVVVTLWNGLRLLIHDPICNDAKCEVIAVDASCMSSGWQLLSSRTAITSVVGAFVLAGNSVGLNATDCSESCDRMMNLP